MPINMFYVKMMKLVEGKEVIKYAPYEFVSEEEAQAYCRELRRKEPGVYLSFWIRQEQGTWKEALPFR